LILPAAAQNWTALPGSATAISANAKGIHRVGRTGRMGSAGRASTLVSGAEIAELRSIERALKVKIARKQVGRCASIARRTTPCPRAHYRACPERSSRKLPSFCRRILDSCRTGDESSRPSG
jgi:superfamily II DNA/RNA helicase